MLCSSSDESLINLCGIDLCTRLARRLSRGTGRIKTECTQADFTRSQYSIPNGTCHTLGTRLGLLSCLCQAPQPPRQCAYLSSLSLPLKSISLTSSGGFPIQSGESAIVISKYLCSLARIVIAGPDTFHLLVNASAARMGIGADDLLTVVINHWIDKVS